MVSAPKSDPQHSHSVSLFDFDNTLYKGEQHYVTLDFPVYLHSQALFDLKSLSELESLKQGYFSGKIKRTDFALGVLDTYYRGLEGKPENDILLAAENFWTLKPDEKWFPYAHKLVELMNKYTVTMLISGSPYEILDLIRKRLGFVHLYATRGSVSNGIYTGSYEPKTELGTYKSKAVLIDVLREQIDFDPEKSFAFGDSESDIPLLQAVSPRNAFLIEGDAPSRELVKQKGWNLLAHDADVFGQVQVRVGTVFSKA